MNTRMVPDADGSGARHAENCDCDASKQLARALNEGPNGFRDNMEALRSMVSFTSGTRQSGAGVLAWALFTLIRQRDGLRFYADADPEDWPDIAKDDAGAVARSVLQGVAT